MKKMKIAVLGLGMALMTSFVSAKATDDKWVTNGNQYFDHTYHEGTVAESFERSRNEIDSQISKVSAGIAGVSAIAGLPLPTNKEVAIGLGVGSFNGKNALAVGVAGNPEGTNVFMKVGVSYATGNENTLSAGVAYGW